MVGRDKSLDTKLRHKARVGNYNGSDNNKFVRLVIYNDDMKRGGYMRRAAKMCGKVLATIILVVAMVIVATGISPIYNFTEPKPFSGNDIFNPYRNVDSAQSWKRANFHTHTRVEGILNECELYPDGVLEAYDRFGYDIVTFSNHNELTRHPHDERLQVNLYEHGYNLLKFHKLVFGAESVNRFDHLLPILPSQRQFQLDLLGEESDIVQINHPLRTFLSTKRMMTLLEGYDLMELDSGRSTENEYWDWALSAGHYSFGVANDDLHYPDRAACIAVRCNFLATPSATYDDLRHTLREGGFYAMRIPNYGSGDWEIKYAKNRELPYIVDIGVEGDEIFIELSESADSITFTGQGHCQQLTVEDSTSARYALRLDEPYTRITAYFAEGEVIYSNPFARYDASTSDSPRREASHTINITLTALYNLLLAAICCMLAWLTLRLYKR